MPQRSKIECLRALFFYTFYSHFILVVVLCLALKKTSHPTVGHHVATVRHLAVQLDMHVLLDLPAVRVRPVVTGTDSQKLAGSSVVHARARVSELAVSFL